MKEIEKDNRTIALNVLYANAFYAYISKHNSNCEKEVLFLIIPNGKEWLWLAVKELSALLIGIMCFTVIFLSELPSLFCNGKQM